MTHPHLSVLLDETLQQFRGRKLRFVLDGTLGAGGHAEAILKEHPEIERYIGMDQDTSALTIARERLAPWKDKVSFVHANFSEMKKATEDLEVPGLDAILLDLGVSSMQLDQAERGFSFNKEGPLDMRMNPDQPLTAAEIVNEWPELEIGKIIRNYGEEKRYRKAARAIVDARKKKPFSTTLELADLLEPILRDHKKRHIHPATKVFQALRIVVNGEIDVLEETLDVAIELLSPGGRFAVITFHSLEDRPVKQAFRYAADDKEGTSGIGGVFLDKDPIVKAVTRKPIVATEEEIEHNPRSRSAKLRVVEKI